MTDLSLDVPGAPSTAEATQWSPTTTARHTALSAPDVPSTTRTADAAQPSPPTALSTAHRIAVGRREAVA
jgi:hypothetical protein